jgi:trk system potassium uptake protein
MKVVIIGCGRLGADLAYRLFKRGYTVSVVDLVSSAFNNLPPDFEGRLNEGDALNQDVLHRAGIETADAVAVVTDSDPLNAILGHLACTEFNVSNVVIRNYDPQARGLLEAFDLQFISGTIWGAQRVEEMISHKEMRTVFSAGNGEVEIYEFIVPEGWAGKPLAELLSGENIRPVALTRAGRAMLPHRDEKLQEGDVLHISGTFDGAEEVRSRLGITKQEA